VTGSTLPAVKAALVDILDGLDANMPAYWTWPGVEQVWSDMGGSHFDRVEAAWLDGRATVSAGYPTLNGPQRRREEEITQVVNIGVQDAREDATLQAVEERALGLFAAFEHAIAGNATLSNATLAAGQQIILTRIDEWTIESGPLENAGYAAVVDVVVVVRAHLV